ncbi:MAG: four helix bundle protein [Acidobacteria bacterium]|nr:four helix bundle protein [Acidobacteriota bacterium]
MFAKSFEDLDVWKKAHAFVLEVYRLTEEFPKHELYGLTSQLRRAAVSIPANIAEGFGKPTKPDKLKFYGVSQGSIEECRYYLRLSRDLGYGDTSELKEILEEVSKMLVSYSRRIRSDQ